MQRETAAYFEKKYGYKRLEPIEKGWSSDKKYRAEDSGGAVYLLRITLAGKDEVSSLRNASGGKYSPCEKCGGDGSVIVYVTNEGDRYHNTIECSGLKRSVRCVPLSEAGGRSPCSRCCA